MSENNKHWTEHLGLITPLLLTISLFILTNIRTQVIDLDAKVFHHLTNAEIHIPRGSVVEKGEFEIYQKMRDSQMASIDKNISDIKDIVKQMSKK